MILTLHMGHSMLRGDVMQAGSHCSGRHGRKQGPMSEGTQQTARADRSATIAFRTSEERKHLVQAAASRRDCLPSDWMRDLLARGLRREFGDLPALQGDEERNI